jgi:hypothetical protein
VNVNRTLQTVDIGVAACSKAMSPRPRLRKGFRMVLTAQFLARDFRKSMLGRDGNESYSFTMVSLGIPGPGLAALKEQVVAGTWTDNFFLGGLRISPIPVNFTTINEPQSSLLGSLRNQSLIPSTSWAYTAGAYY